VINLVMDDHGVEAFINPVEGLSVFIQPRDAQAMWTGSLPIQSWEVKATIEVFSFITGFDDLGVNQDNGRPLNAQPRPAGGC